MILMKRAFSQPAENDRYERKALNAAVSSNARFWGRAMPLCSDCGLSGLEAHRDLRLAQVADV